MGIVWIPFLGRQIVVTRVTSESITALQLAGAIRFPNTALWYRCLAGGPLELELPHALSHLMH